MAARDRAAIRVDAEVGKAIDGSALKGVVARHADKCTKVYTDDASAYRGIQGVRHRAAQHSTGEFVNNQANKNRIESA